MIDGVTRHPDGFRADEMLTPGSADLVTGGSGHPRSHRLANSNPTITHWYIPAKQRGTARQMPQLYSHAAVVCARQTHDSSRRGSLAHRNQSAFHLLVDKRWRIGICSCPLDVTGYFTPVHVHEHVTGYLSRANEKSSEPFSRSNGPYRERVRYFYGH